MTQRNNLYRRSSGIHVLRITVPVRYRVQWGQREIHASTRTTDQSAAKAIACRLLDHWNSYVSELEMGQSGLPEADEVSTSKAVISVGELSAASGLQVEHELRELLNNNILTHVWPAQCSTTDGRSLGALSSIVRAIQDRQGSNERKSRPHAQA